MIPRALSRLDAAYPSADDRAAIEQYLATTESRRAALDEIRPLIGPVADYVVQGMQARYPQFARYRSTGFDKIHRDITMITALAGNAMFLAEDETTDDMFTVWFKTILKGAHGPPQFMRDGLGFWQDGLRTRLSPAAWGLLRPHVEHMTEVLTDLPVPARDEIGERRMAAAGRG
jgi:hypothetical protein